MESRLKTAVAALAGLVALAGSAVAHPHVFVSMQTELVYAADGKVTGVRHVWTFDDMFSAYATQGLDQKTKGVFTREELAPLAEVNVTSLKEFDFFTYMKADGRKAALADPVDYWLVYKDERLTLQFTLPLKSAVKPKALDVEMYDPSYYVDFSFTDKDPVALVGAPPACKMTVARPQDMNLAQGKRLSESFFDAASAAQNYGAQFASRIAVKCP